MRSSLAAVCLAFAAVFSLSADAQADKTLADYKLFRALSIDLNGQMPTLADLAAFESPQFDLKAWTDDRLNQPMYADRMTRIYADLLRLQIGDAYQTGGNLAAAQILDPTGKPVLVFYRIYQKRTRDTGSSFCLTQAETGIAPKDLYDLTVGAGAVPADPQAFDKYTKLVSPWWLYADYKSPNPTDRFGPSWTTTHPGGYQPNDQLNYQPPFTHTSPLVMQVRVCNEEAQTSDTGQVTETNSSQATLTQTVDCKTGSGEAASNQCGCGVGLERCYPTTPYGFITLSSSGFPLGPDNPVDAPTNNVTTDRYLKTWWAAEADQFLRYIFAGDRDFREVLTARYTLLNGPAALFYKGPAQGDCCGTGFANGPLQTAIGFGYYQPQPLFEPANVPKDLTPADYDKWEVVPDRGPLAAGIMTMPVFLVKFGTRRARAHILYNVFECRDFQAQNLQLEPSTEPNLMKRPGCSACHTALEPMAAYFTRIVEGDWTYLPQKFFPQTSSMCNDAAFKSGTYGCNEFYDPAFADPMGSMMRGIYGSPQNAEAGPAGLGAALTSGPDFGPCVVQNIAQSFLGRPLLSPDDDPLKSRLSSTLASSGFTVKAVVRALLESDAYAKVNNYGSTDWRQVTP